MVIVMFACSEKAYLLMQELKQKWTEVHPEDEIIDFVKCSALSEKSVKSSVSELTGEWFFKADVLIYFSATGIAIRSIAPYLKHKSQDPAVLVMDETGKFCISLLSGHAGGANMLTQEVAHLLKEKNTIPVITTATDREGKFAVDDFARKNHLRLKDWELAKKISAQILQGEKIGFVSDIAICGQLPEELQYLAEKGISRTGIWISCRSGKPPYEETLRLIPRSLIVGIGCRKGTAKEKIEQAIRECFAKAGLLTDGISAITSIDLKKQEKGILDYCEKNHLPFMVYSKEELVKVEGKFTASEFVTEITGVDNVCERSAVLGAMQLAEQEDCSYENSRLFPHSQSSSEDGKQQNQDVVKLLIRKKCYEGVTVAVAEMIKRIEI